MKEWLNWITFVVAVIPFIVPNIEKLCVLRLSYITKDKSTGLRLKQKHLGENKNLKRRISVLQYGSYDRDVTQSW